MKFICHFLAIFPIGIKECARVKTSVEGIRNAKRGVRTRAHGPIAMIKFTEFEIAILKLTINKLTVDKACRLKINSRKQNSFKSNTFVLTARNGGVF